MALAESRVTTRRSLPVGIFSVVVAVVLVVIAMVWFRFGTPRTSIIWLVMAVLEIVIAILMLRPITFHVVVDEDGVRNEGHSPWSIDRASIAHGGVIAAKHPTLWVRPVREAALKRSQGYTETTVVPERSYLAPVRRSQAENLARALASIGLEAGRKASPDEINTIGAFKSGATAMSLTGVAARAAAESDPVGPAPDRAAEPDAPRRESEAQGQDDPRSDRAEETRILDAEDVIEATEPIGWPRLTHPDADAAADDAVLGTPEPIGWPVNARRATAEEDAAWLYGDKASSTVVTTEETAPQRASRGVEQTGDRADPGGERPRRARRAVPEDDEDDRPTRPMRAITDDMTYAQALGIAQGPSS